MQTSLFDLENRYASLSAAGDPLERLNAVNGWEIFRPILERIDAKERKSAAGRNQCKGCHDRPQMWGAKRKGLPTPIPESHYTDMRNDPGTVGKKLVSARSVCTQCHVPRPSRSPWLRTASRPARVSYICIAWR